jgi:hypothetical protein
MASSYTDNLKLEKILTGEQDGTWGVTEGKTLDLLDEAINGIATITLTANGSTGSPNDQEMAEDSGSDAIRHKFIIVSDDGGGGMSAAAAYLRLLPVSAEKVCYIQNSMPTATDLHVFQGTHDATREYIIPNGRTACLRFDGLAATTSYVRNVFATGIFDGLYFKNNTYLSWRNAADTDNITFGWDTNDDLQVSVNGTTIFNHDSSESIANFNDQEVRTSSVMSLVERAAPLTFAATIGQVWNKNTSPSELWYTDDAGTDFKISGGGTSAFQKTITIENPSATEDLTIGFTNAAITITEIRAVLIGSSTPSVTWTIRKNADRSATGTEVVTGGTATISTTTGSDVTSLDSAALPADEFYWLETTAQSGTVTELSVTIIGTYD